VYKAALAKTLEDQRNCLGLKQREKQAFDEFLLDYL
jgi:hypothetical protein